jgi:hypothetical protein
MTMATAERYNGCANWGTWYVGTLIADIEEHHGNSQRYRELVEGWLAEGYGQMERRDYDELLLAHTECDYWEIAGEFRGTMRPTKPKP